MADYYPLLARAVAGLTDNTEQARAAIYERARNALVGQLRRLDPPIPQEQIDRESDALDVAIARLEAEALPAPREAEIVHDEDLDAAEPVPTAEPPVDAPAPDVGPGAPDLDEGAPARESEAPPPAEEDIAPEPRRRPGQPASLQTRPPMFFKSRRDRVPLDPGAARVSLEPQPLAPPPAENFADAAPGASPEAVALDAPTPEWRDEAPPAIDESAPNGVEPPRTADEPFSDAAAPSPSKSEAQRPFAPLPRRDEPSPRRTWLIGFVVGLVVLLVALAAYQLRDKPEDLRQKAEAQATPPPEPAPPPGKIVDRVGSGAPGEPSAPRQADAAPPRPAQPSPAQSARRAALLVEAPNEPGKVKTLLGAVVWKVENVSAGPTDPLSTAVRATVEIPEEKLEVVVTLQKNFDASLPASHTMKIQFVEGEGDPLGPVQQISAPQMRREDTATGDALAGVPVKITENTFLVGLSGGDAEAGNLDLIRTRGWIDVPMLLSDGKIAKLTFEKGEAGERAIADAIETWKAQ